MHDPLLDPSIDPAQLSMHELGALVDSLQGLRDRKAALNREIEDVASQAERARKLILAALEYQGVTSIGGSVSRCTMVSKEVPRAVSWSDLYDHIIRTGEFDLLHRRIGEAAVRERWASGTEVPGVEAAIVRDLSLSRVR